jgi:hypothetical protein
MRRPFSFVRIRPLESSFKRCIAALGDRFASILADFPGVIAENMADIALLMAHLSPHVEISEDRVYENLRQLGELKEREYLRSAEQAARQREAIRSRRRLTGQRGDSRWNVVHPARLRSAIRRA